MVILANAILIILVSDYEIQNLGEAIPEDWATRTASRAILPKPEGLDKSRLSILSAFRRSSSSR